MTSPTTPLYPGSRRLALPRNRHRSSSDASGKLTIGSDPLHDVLGSYDLTPSGSARNIDQISRADNVVVDTKLGPKLLKRYKSSVTVEAIRHEHAVLSHLAERSFPAPRLNPAIDGSTMVEHDGRWHALFDYHPGYFHYNEYVWSPRAQDRLLSLSGKALGALHTALADFVPPAPHPLGFQSVDGHRRDDLDWYLSELDRTRLAAPEIVGPDAARFRGVLRDAGPRVEARLSAIDSRLGTAELPRQVIHGDYGPYNLLIRHGERAIILDFELSRMDWRILDLAKAYQQFALNRFGLRPKRFASFMAGYRCEQDIRDDELAQLASVWTFLSFRRTIVCWARYVENGDSRWLSEAENKLALVKRISSATDTVAEIRVGLGEEL